MLTFKVAFGIAAAMVVIGVVNKHFAAGYFALVLLYLLLASFLPWLMVPLGIVIVIAEVLSPNSNLATWISSFQGTNEQ